MFVGLSISGVDGGRITQDQPGRGIFWRFLGIWFDAEEVIFGWHGERSLGKVLFVLKILSALMAQGGHSTDFCPGAVDNRLC